MHNSADKIEQKDSFGAQGGKKYSLLHDDIISSMHFGYISQESPIKTHSKMFYKVRMTRFRENTMLTFPPISE